LHESLLLMKCGHGEYTAAALKQERPYH